jgi:uroporphyrinogen-III decarboxylase
VFGLGHGILPTTPLAGVEAMVQAVTEWRGHSIDKAKKAV